MPITRIREVKVEYNRSIEEYLQRFCNADRLKHDSCPKHLRSPVLLLHYHRQPTEYCPPSMEVCNEAVQQEFKPLFIGKQRSENAFNGISSYLSETRPKSLNWHPPAHIAEAMSETELDAFTQEKIRELEFVLKGDVQAGVYACDIEASCFKAEQPQNSWSLNGLVSRFSRYCDRNPTKKLALVSGLKNLTYVSEKNTVSPLHIEDGDMWSINFHWRGAPKLWIFFESKFLLTYIHAVRRDLAGKSF